MKRGRDGGNGLNSTQCEVASLAHYGTASGAQVSAGNVVHFGELADDGVLLGDDASKGIELGLDDGKIVLEARDLVRSVV